MGRGALIIGSSIAGIQAALDLADSGMDVHLLESSPFLSNECAENNRILMNTRLLEVVHHPQITLWTNTSTQRFEQEGDYFQVDLRQNPRYIDLDRCTACGECITVCPVTVLDLCEEGKEPRKAIYLDGQPGCAAIDKLGKSPCASTCPGGIHVQGYIALIGLGRYQEAIELILDAIPFPSVCGRVCNHYCEAQCSRGVVDAPVNIMGLKRFVADWAFAKRNELPNIGEEITHTHPSPTGKTVAIIGAGPAGLTAARSLVRMGYAVTVFDALPAAGGMMRVGIPPHRLPTELLDWEIQQIINEGVKLELNTWVADIPGLLECDYDAALIATGAHRAKKLPIRNSNHPDNWLSLDVLRRVRQGEVVNLKGKKVVVLGGGNVALDTVRTVIRLGASEVRMVSLESRGEMPGFDWEINVAEEEGVEVLPGRTFKEIIVERNKVVGVRCMEVDFHSFEKGRPDFEEIPDTEHVLPADIVIWAIGQEPDFSFLPHDGSIDTRFPIGIRSDENMMTTMPGVFVAGDVHRGMTFFVIDAIGEGKKAARSIDRYLRGAYGEKEPVELTKVVLSKEECNKRLTYSNISRRMRTQISSIPMEDRIHNFLEVDLTLTEDEARTEARRCLGCGVCSECMSCEHICKTGAVIHEQMAKHASLKIGAVIYADIFERFASLPFSGVEKVYRVTPEDALLGSCAAARVMVDLENQRQPLHTPATPSVKSGPARIGVFICQCGDAIAQKIDTLAVCDQVSTWPDVIHTEVLPFSCSPEAAHLINIAIEAHALDRVVLAACSCCNFDQVCYSCTYQRVRSKDNLGLFAPIRKNWPVSGRFSNSARFEFINIREQCAWVHADDPQMSTAKAITLVAATVARAQAAPAVLAGARSIDNSALVLGGGPAAPICKKTFRQLGIIVHQVEGMPTEIQRSDGLYTVTSGEQTWQASTLVLIPGDSEEARELLIAFGRERRRPQVHSAWGGLDTHRPGIYYITPEQNPAVAGTAAAARVAAWINRTESRPPIAAIVDPDRCRACKTCIDTCEYCAPELIEINGRYTSWIDPAICTSCGTCAAHCPSGAISAGCSTDAQLEAILGAILS